MNLEIAEQTIQKRGPNLPSESFSDYMARQYAMPFKGYFDYLARLVDKWKLFDLLNKPGEAVSEYIKRRRTMQDLVEIAQWCRGASENYNIEIPERLQWYPCTTYINKGQGVSRDYLAERETQDVLVYVLENTNRPPQEEPKFKNANKETIAEEIVNRSVEVHSPSGEIGFGRLILAPGCVVALPLCADPWLPRVPLPDAKGRPCTRVGKYDPTDPCHNVRLRGRPGIGVDVTQYIYAEDIRNESDRNTSTGNADKDGEAD